MYRAHQIRLYPNKEQEQFLLQSCGIARFSYNWALAKWKEQYESGLKVNEGKLRKELNSIKRDEYPWMMEVSKCVPQSAIKNLGKAFDNFFRNVKQGKKPGYPKFKKKGISQDSFTLDYLSFQLDGRYLRIAKMMKCPIRMAESLRYPECKPLIITIKRIADRWFASIRVELDDIDTVHENQGTSIGVDLGITCAVTLSDGRKIFAPKPLEKMLRKLKRLSRSLSRKQKGSKNRNKARIKLARLHYRITCIRKDFWYKITHELSKSYETIYIEDLNVAGMIKNHCLSRKLADVSIGMFRPMIEYKAVQVHAIDRWYPSSKTCSACNYYNPEIVLGVSEWACPSCGTIHDRDVNASKNILAQGMRELTPVEISCSKDGLRSRKFKVVGSQK